MLAQSGRVWWIGFVAFSSGLALRLPSGPLGTRVRFSRPNVAAMCAEQSLCYHLYTWKSALALSHSWEQQEPLRTRGKLPMLLPCPYGFMLAVLGYRAPGRGWEGGVRFDVSAAWNDTC